MAKQTMKIHADRANTANSTAHLNPPSVPIGTALEIAMVKAGLLLDRDKPKTVNPDLVAMYENLEQQMLLLRAAIHYDKIEKGIIAVDQSSPFCVAHPEPFVEPVNYKTGRLLLDTDIHIIGKSKSTPKPKTYNVKAESVPTDDFDPTPVKAAVKAESVKRDDHKAGKESFADTFRDAVMEAFAQAQPGYVTEAHTVPKAETPELARKFRVFFEIHHLGSKILLKRLSKKAYKAFEAEIPLVNGKLNREMIPAYAVKK